MPYGYGPPQTILYGRETNGIAIAAGVCGIIAAALCWIPFVDYFSIVLGVLAIIFGILGIHRAVAYGSGRGMAITGIVCGAVGLTIAFLFLLLIYAVISTATVIGAAVS
jgi:TM2 domain-containing membrane protein YozV